MAGLPASTGSSSSSPMGSILDKLNDHDTARTPSSSLSTTMRNISLRVGRRGLLVLVLFTFIAPILVLRGMGGYMDNLEPLPEEVTLLDSVSPGQVSLDQVLPATETVTVRVIVPAPTPTPHEPEVIVKHVPAPVETVTFAIISMGHDSAREAAVLVKSALMYSSVPTEFHIICDEEVQSYLSHRLALVTHPVHDVKVIFYRLTQAAMIARINREGSIATDHAAGKPGLMKLFIHEILPPTVHKVIFVDTDALFVADPLLLWRTFSEWKQTTMISMPTHMDQDAAVWHYASKICSCIMLFDLDALREVRLMDSSAYRADTDGVKAYSPPMFEKLYGAPVPGEGYQDVKLGDQGYWWAIVNQTDRFEHLSLEWEVSSCLLDMYGLGALMGEDSVDIAHELDFMLHTENTPHAGQALFPKLLHFNCITVDGTYWEWPGWTDPKEGMSRRWGPTVQYHVSYKWLWLNNGDKGPRKDDPKRPKITIETVENVVFADEIFAHNAGQPFKELGHPHP